jgi:hypothetical protein
VQTEQILALLIEERDRLMRAINVLQHDAPKAAVKRRGRRVSKSSPAIQTQPAAAPAPAKKAPAAAAVKPKRVLSAAGRRAIAEAARKRWAAVRAAKAKPAAKESDAKPKKARA